MKQLKLTTLLVLALFFSGYTHAAFMPPVEVEGREWLQVSDFTNLSWNDVSVVCDPDTGECSGALAGGSLDGWTWAAWSDAVVLIDSFISDSPSIWDIDASILAIFSVFQSTFSSFDLDEFSLDLFASTRTLSSDGLVTTAHISYFDSFGYVLASYNTQAPLFNAPDAARSHIGHFFYRDVHAVPLPATELFTLLGLAGLVVIRRTSAR